MKTFFKRAGVLCLLVILLPAISYAEIYSGSCGQDVEWKLDTETGLLEIYNRQPGAYSNMDNYSYISGYISGYAPWYSYTEHIRSVNLSGISNIGSYAFYNCSSLTSVSIPESVTSIGGGAFSGCSGLTSVSIPESVTSIGGGAFYNTPWLNKRPDGLVYAGKVAYKYKGTMPSGTHITIEEGTVEITDGAFSGCSGLTSITIPESVTSIGYEAFYDCSGLTSITIPEGVTRIDDYTFRGCSGLTSVTIPESVTSIGNSTFYNCSGLTSVTIPKSVTSIGYVAFYGCSGLTSVIIPKSVTSIGYDAFSGCYFSRYKFINKSVLISENYWGATLCDEETGDGLLITDHIVVKCRSWASSVCIPESVTSIGQSAFSGCSSLTSITIPESVTSIGGSAFSGCSGMTSVTIPESVTSIGQVTFHGCSGLTSITIPEGVTSIGYGAFYNCSGLTSVTIPESVNSIGSLAFASCSDLTSVRITDLALWCNISFEDNYSNPLYYAKHLYIDNQEIKDLVIPKGVTSIGNYAFVYCSGLTSVTIPESVTSIGNYAFVYCRGLTSVTIPESVNSIGSSAFAACNNLTSVTINSNAITSATYSSEKNIGTIFGAQVKEYIIGGSNIGDYAFYKNSVLESITILKSVTSIDQVAFYGCSGLTSVTLNSNAIASATYSSSQNIGTMFGSQVKNYMFGDEVKRIGESAFASSKEVVSIVLGRNIERIQDNAFSGCDKIEEVRVKASEPPIAFSTAFPDNAYYAVLYVPEGTEALYKEDNVWGRFSRIRTFKDEPEKCVLSIKSAIGGYLEMICNTQTSYTFRIITEKGWQVSSVSFNGVDVTGNITEDSYTTPLLEGDAELSVVFEMDEDEIDMVNEVGSHSQLRVSASASTIFIHNDGDPVNSYIYTTDGKMVKSVVASYGKTVIPVQPDNVYVVKVNNRTFKVAL